MKPCSVCRHKRRAEIDRMLVAGCSYRTITTLFSDLSPQALGRHKRAHIPELLRKAAQDREAEDLQEAKDLARQCARYLRKANEMLGAADSWLRDPDTGEYNLDPRSTEVSVIYSQLIGGKEVRKKAPLSELLAKLEQGRPVVVHNTTWRVSDPRDL
ncbi:MAG: hypothetical protein JXA57_19330, partial [Armatimonadetes bacterium]|nr:hypothetical protein [Armatimonadota bacterium]